MNRSRPLPASRAPRAAASILLLLAAWLLPGLHGLWCDHDHGTDHAYGAQECGGALSTLVDSDTHRHGCASIADVHGPEADQPGQRDGGQQVKTASNPFAGCILELLVPNPGTDLEPETLRVGRSLVAHAPSRSTGTAPRAIARHLLAPKNSPPAEGRRRQA